MDDRDRPEKRSGSYGSGVGIRGAGEECALELREGVNDGSEGNLWRVVSSRRIAGGCCK